MSRGPVLVVITYGNDENATCIANDSIYGLSGGIWGSQDRSMRITGRTPHRNDRDKRGHIHVMVTCLLTAISISVLAALVASRHQGITRNQSIRLACQ
jgi:hypothetical protein